MAVITGTNGDETLVGTTGDDVIEGLGGSDQLEGREGNDTLRGGGGWDDIDAGSGDDILDAGDDGAFMTDGPGNDVADGGSGRDFFNNDSGNDTLRGGDGDDEYQISRGSSQTDTITITDGAGADRIRLLVFGPSTVNASSGEGDDRFDIERLGGLATLTLGSGRDSVNIDFLPASHIGLASIVITDYELGPAADHVDFLGFIARNFTGWDHALSPFATGHARLVQNGADALLQFDLDGGGDGYVTLITFQNRTVASFDPANLDGYRADGTIPAGLDVNAGGGDDRLYGLAGADRIDAGGGNDFVYGGAGNDVIYGGAGFNNLFGQVGDDEIHGGDDTDQIDGGYGDDKVFAGGGSDYISSERGNDELDGGDGDDRFHVARGSLTDTDVTIIGGSGHDQIDIFSWGPSRFEVDAGADNDTIRIGPLAATATITLGPGSDQLVLAAIEGLLTVASGVITITDFGAGDSFDFADFLTTYYNWQGDNPFGNGYFRLDQDGADTVLGLTQGGDTYRPFIIFENVQKSSLTADNFLGYSPDGSPPPPLHLVGDEFDNLLKGQGGNDLIEGGAGSDSLHGMGGADEIRGGDGIDVINGGNGDDLLDGGDGGDNFDAGRGFDRMFGGAGDDRFRDELGSGVIFGGDGNDELYLERHYLGGETVQFYGGNGDDSFTLNAGMAGTWIFDGGEGDDLVTIWAMVGTANIWLGAGSDRLVLTDTFSNHPGAIFVADFDADADVLDLSGFLAAYLIGWDGNTNPFTTGHARLVQSGSDALIEIDRDGAGGAHGWESHIRLLNFSAGKLGVGNFGYTVTTVWGSGGDDVFVGTALDQIFHGASGNDVLRGEGGNDVLYGENGNDELHGGAGGDWMEGGAGDDVYFADNAGDSIIERSGEGIDEVRTVFAAASLFGSHIENLTSNANVSHDFRASALNNVIRGGALRDVVRLQDGGNDTAITGDGNDTIYFGAAFNALDTVHAGSGVDAIILQGNYAAGITLGSGSVSNISGVESISLAPGDIADYGDTANNSYSYNLTAIDANVAADGILRINGHHLRSGENFTFDGSLETSGRFFVFGGLGVDHFTGGDGNDIFVFGHDGRFGPTDIVHGGPGYDSLYLRGDYDLDFTQGGFGTFTGIESLTLGWASDTQFVVGGDGEFDYDIVWDDSMLADDARITVNGSGLAANETMLFDGSDEAGGDFRLWGGASNDTITGGGGDDLIYGGYGADLLRGNGGADTYRYQDIWESYADAFDTIQGFTHGVDVIDLSIIDANVNVAGDQAFRFAGSDPFAPFGNSVGQLRAFQVDPQTNTWRIEGDVSGDGSVDFVLQVVVQAGQPLTAADFIL